MRVSNDEYRNYRLLRRLFNPTTRYKSRWFCKAKSVWKNVVRIVGPSVKMLPMDTCANTRPLDRDLTSLGHFRVGLDSYA